MSDAHPTAPAASVKVAKPHPAFPLTPHRAGYWCKKIRGKVHYFGPRFKPDDPAAATAAADEALKDYLAKKDALHEGRKPRETTEGLTVNQLVNKFMASKEALVESGELTPRTLADYQTVCEKVALAFGKGRLVSDIDPDDFAKLRKKVAKQWGPERLGSKLIQYTRSLFNHAFDEGLIEKPVRFGPGFKRPSKKTLRLKRAERGPKLFTADQIRQMLDHPKATASMRAMLLLGINCGFGNADCGQLPLSAVNLDTGWVDFPRPKTGIARRCHLWAETVEAIRAVLANRPTPKNPADAALVFLTAKGYSWCKDTSTNPVSQETAKLMKKSGISGRAGLGFYTLRHVFRTVADEVKDQPATDFIMGHEVPHMSAVYRETISDERLKAVTDHVRAWLYPPKRTEAKAE